MCRNQLSGSITQLSSRDHVIRAFDDQQTQALEFLSHAVLPECMLPEQFDFPVQAFHEVEFSPLELAAV